MEAIELPNGVDFQKKTGRQVQFNLQQKLLICIFIVNRAYLQFYLSLMSVFITHASNLQKGFVFLVVNLQLLLNFKAVIIKTFQSK